MPDCLEWIRQTLHAPAYIGGRVHVHVHIPGRPQDAAQTGVIKGGDDELYILFDGDKTPTRHHPRNCIDYFDKDGNEIASFGDE